MILINIFLSCLFPGGDLEDKDGEQNVNENTTTGEVDKIITNATEIDKIQTMARSCDNAHEQRNQITITSHGRNGDNANEPSSRNHIDDKDRDRGSLEGDWGKRFN